MAQIKASMVATQADIERLGQIMTAWWRGHSLATIARVQGISRQRVHSILKRVGCSASLRAKAIRQPEPQTPRARPTEREVAQICLLHPSAWRFAPSQRCALAWLAQGLNTVAAGHRMAILPQAVAGLAYRARKHLQQMDGTWSPVPVARQRKPKAVLSAPTDAEPVTTKELDDWFTDLVGSLDLRSLSVSAADGSGHAPAAPP